MKASTLIKLAQQQIGVTEYPPTSNNVKYNTEYWGYECYGDEEYPWCMAFVWWCFKHAGGEELFLNGQRSASCPTVAHWAQNNGYWVTRNYKPGDVLIFRFSGSGYDHTGILEEVGKNGTYIVIEGNTSLTCNDNGGAVMRRLRYDSQIVGAYRPCYEDENEDTERKKEDEDEMSYEQFKNYIKQYRKELQDNDNGCWSKEDRDWAIRTKLMQGSGTLPDGSINYMWEDFLTREQAAALMHRLAEYLEK